MRVVVFGAGAVGLAVGARLVAEGRDVALAQRRRPASLPHGAGFVAADALDPSMAAAACAGADVVINALGFPYDRRVWARAWPQATRSLLAACETAGARYVFADNLYMYGPVSGPLREDLPLTSRGAKPRIRAEVTRLWQEAHRAGRVRAVAVRASDFYGPNAPHSVLAEYGVKPLLAGKPAVAFWPPDQPHDQTYLGDFARAIASLVGAPDQAFGRAWHVPNAPTRTTRELLRLAAEIAGAPFRLLVFPGAARAVLGLFSPPLRELGEMRFQWDRPYRVDASDFAAQFWADATPFEQGLRATIDALREGR